MFAPNAVSQPIAEIAPPPTRAEEAALLRQRIEESGMSPCQFAVEVLNYDECTIRLWLAQSWPIPAVVVDFLEDPVMSLYPWTPTPRDWPPKA